jgi:hypothetical protein
MTFDALAEGLIGNGAGDLYDSMIGAKKFRTLRIHFTSGHYYMNSIEFVRFSKLPKNEIGYFRIINR